MHFAKVQSNQVNMQRCPIKGGFLDMNLDLSSIVELEHNYRDEID